MNLPFIPRGPGDHVLGLDIGTHAIKVVELKRSGGEFEITRFAHRVVPFAVQEDDQQVAAIIRELFDEQNIGGRRVYLAVSGQNVVIRRTALPKMPLSEMVDAIKWDAREEILFDLEQAEVDFHITGETNQAGGVYNELLTVIAEGGHIQRHVKLAQSAGLKLLGVTAFPIALWDYNLTHSEVAAGEVTCFIDMGAERTRVYFASNNDLLFFREIPTGGQNVTEALMVPFELPNGKRLALDEQRAEEIKIEYGFPPEGAPGETKEGLTLAELSDTLLPVLNKQAEEIYRSIEYFKNLFKRDDINRITVSGGAGGLKGFYQFLSEMLEIEIQPSNPLLQSSPPVTDVTEAEAESIGPSLTGAAGLALGRCDKINLLPESLRPSLKKQLVKLAWAAVIPLVLGGLYVHSSMLRGEVEALERAIDADKKKLVQYQQVLASLNGPKQELSDLNHRKQQLRQEISQMPVGVEAAVDFPAFLRDLAVSIPENGSLQQLTYSTKDEEAETEEEVRLILEGNLFGNEDEALQSMEGFLRNLERSPRISDVKLIHTVRLGGDQFTRAGLSFTIALKLVQESARMS